MKMTMHTPRRAEETAVFKRNVSDETVYSENAKEATGVCYVISVSLSLIAFQNEVSLFTSFTQLLRWFASYARVIMCESRQFPSSFRFSLSPPPFLSLYINIIPLICCLYLLWRRNTPAPYILLQKVSKGRRTPTIEQICYHHLLLALCV